MIRTSTVDREVFSKFPTFRRAVIAASTLDNRAENREISQLLTATIQSRYVNPVDLKTDLSVAKWMHSHFEFGSNPNRFPPSHVALLKRVQNGKSLPFISPLVAIMNIASIDFSTSVGGDDAESVSEELILRFATGEERFVPLFEPDILENPQTGELIYVDNSGCVMCRRWNWRNSHQSRITESTRFALINVDGLGSDAIDLVAQAAKRLADLLEWHLGATTQTVILEPNHNSVVFELGDFGDEH